MPYRNFKMAGVVLGVSLLLTPPWADRPAKAQSGTGIDVAAMADLVESWIARFNANRSDSLKMTISGRVRHSDQNADKSVFIEDLAVNFGEKPVQISFGTVKASFRSGAGSTVLARFDLPSVGTISAPGDGELFRLNQRVRAADLVWDRKLKTIRSYTIAIEKFEMLSFPLRKQVVAIDDIELSGELVIDASGRWNSRRRNAVNGILINEIGAESLVPPGTKIARLQFQGDQTGIRLEEFLAAIRSVPTEGIYKDWLLGGTTLANSVAPASEVNISDELLRELPNISDLSGDGAIRFQISNIQAPGLINLDEISFFTDGQRFPNGQAKVSLELDMDDLDFLSAAKDERTRLIRAFAPVRGRIDLGVDALPLKRIIEISINALLNIPETDRNLEKIQIDPNISLLLEEQFTKRAPAFIAALQEARTALLFDDVSLEAKAYKAALSGKLTADGTSSLGWSGRMMLEIENIENIITGLRQDGLGPRVADILEKLATLPRARVTTAQPSDASLTRLELEIQRNGEPRLNGLDQRAVQQHLGTLSQAQ